MPGRQPFPKVEPVWLAKGLEPLLTMIEVQRMLQLRKPKVYELMRSRGLPSLNMDGARRFERAAFQAWIEQQKELSEREHSNTRSMEVFR